MICRYIDQQTSFSDYMMFPRFLLDTDLSPENRELVEQFTTILDKPLFQRIRTLRKYSLRKNRAFHTFVFRTLIITKFGYRRNK